MQRNSPFARAIAAFAAIAAVARGAFTAQEFVVANAPYHSRGKGKGLHSGKKWGPPSSGRYAGAVNGEREMARRRSHLARGIIHAL